MSLELTETFSRLHHPVPLLKSTVRDFVTANVSGDVRSKQTCDDKKAPVRITLPSKGQRSVNSVQRQLELLRAASPKYQLALEIAKKTNFSKLAQKEALRALVTKILF